MSLPNPKRQKGARKTLENVFNNANHVWVTHYSCESFYERPEGRSARITSVAVRRLDTAQTISFSIHQVAERNGVPPAEIAQRYDALERKMLDEFYAHVGAHRGDTFLHWNMRDINFGFAAIEHRYRVLGGEPEVIDDGRKVDLSRIIISIYGVGYIGHPRIEKLMDKNNITPLDFMTGAQEAAAFDVGNYVGLHQSTLRKVDIFANFAARAIDRTLKTNTTKWQMHGGTLYSAVNWVAENKLVSLGVGAAGVVLSILAL